MQTAGITPANLRVSRIGLGCVTFGREIDEAAAHGLLGHAYARGIMFLLAVGKREFDCVNQFAAFAEWFENQPIYALPEGANGSFHRAVTGHDEHSGVGLQTLRVLNNFKAIHFGHADVY